MKKLYLIGSVIVFLLILTLSLPQIGSNCDWELINMNANPTLILFQAAGLGGILGGLLISYWKFPVENQEDDEEEIGSGGGDVTKMESEDGADKKE